MAQEDRADMSALDDSAKNLLQNRVFRTYSFGHGRGQAPVMARGDVSRSRDTCGKSTRRQARRPRQPSSAPRDIVTGARLRRELQGLRESSHGPGQTASRATRARPRPRSDRRGCHAQMARSCEFRLTATFRTRSSPKREAGLERQHAGTCTAHHDVAGLAITGRDSSYIGCHHHDGPSARRASQSRARRTAGVAQDLDRSIRALRTIEPPIVRIRPRVLSQLRNESGLSHVRDLRYRLLKHIDGVEAELSSDPEQALSPLPLEAHSGDDFGRRELSSRRRARAFLVERLDRQLSPRRGRDVCRLLGPGQLVVDPGLVRESRVRRARTPGCSVPRPGSVPRTTDAIPGDVARHPLGVDRGPEPRDLRRAALRAWGRRLVRRGEILLELLLARFAAILVDRHP